MQPALHFHKTRLPTQDQRTNVCEREKERGGERERERERGMEGGKERVQNYSHDPVRIAKACSNYYCKFVKHITLL